jgi:hypothetical protein
MFRFGRKKEQATYGDMDDDEREMWRAMKGKGGDLLNSDSDDDADGGGGGGHRRSTSDGGGCGGGGGGGSDGESDADGDGDGGFFALSTGVKANSLFGGMDKDKAASTVAITFKFPATVSWRMCTHAVLLHQSRLDALCACSPCRSRAPQLCAPAA